MPERQQFHSEEAHEIMDSPPRWIIRWGMVVIFLIFGSSFVFSFFISVPEFVTGTITITTDNPPASLTPRVDGRIDTLFFTSHSPVEKGTTLAVIQNGSKYRSVLDLERRLTACETMTTEHVVRLFRIDSTYDLDGELKDGYATFRSVCNELNDYLKTGPDKASTLYGQKIFDYGTLIRSLREALMNRIRQWKESYTITAPVSGELVWAHTGQAVRSVPLGAVLPDSKHSVELCGDMIVENENYQKITVGQKVKVTLGTMSGMNEKHLSGIVELLLPLTDKAGYRVQVRFEDSMPEAYLKILTHSQAVIASAQIVVGERRLVDLYLPHLNGLF